MLKWSLNLEMNGLEHSRARYRLISNSFPRPRERNLTVKYSLAAGLAELSDAGNVNRESYPVAGSFVSQHVSPNLRSRLYP